VSRTDRRCVVRCVTASALIGVALLAVGCGAGGDIDEEDRPVSSPPRVSRENGAAVVALDAGEQARAGLLVEALAAASNRAELAVYGSVLDLTGLAETSGAIAAARARLGGARAALAAARAEYERTKALAGDGRAASEKALEQTMAAFHVAEAEDQGAQSALTSLVADARQRWGGVIAGWLDRGSPRLDALLQQRDRLVQLTIPGDATLESLPETATLHGTHGSAGTARLVSPAPATDPRIQGETFLCTAAAVPWLLPGASVSATLVAGPPRTGVAVPGTAVVWWAGKAWVYVERSPGTFVRRQVPTDAPVAGGWFVSGGLAPGDRVVVRGAQLLLSEEGRAAVHGSEG
jgi:hypothetical protein